MAQSREQHELTVLLEQISRGDRAAADQVFPLVYAELRALAGSFFQNQNADHTLQPTALVHDAYIRMVDQTNPQWKDRSHFFAVAATAMRHILTDHVRKQRAIKRGGDGKRVTLMDNVAVTPERSIDVLALDEALTRLAQLDERKCRVVELRFFSGLTNESVADVLGVSRATVADDWTVARAWLKNELSRGDLP